MDQLIQTYQRLLSEIKPAYYRQFYADHTLLDIADQFVKLYGGELLCIDEIHKYRNWNQELKNIYDSYPKLKVIFSGSSSINLVRGKYDLSRRALTRQMQGFSFHE